MPKPSTCRPRSELKPSVPLISVIIVVFRDRAELESIVHNIAPFRGQDLELIVIDGGSTDGSVEFLKANTADIDYWISEQDHGIYDAMNKGLRAARGIYVLHINAGDRLRKIPWEDLHNAATEEIDVVACRVLMDGRTEFLPRTSLTSKIDNTWHHQGTFYRRAAHLGYDLSYPFCGDFEHNQRLLRAHCSFILLPDVIADHLNNGRSTEKAARKDIYRSVRNHFGGVYVVLAAVRFTLAPFWMYFKKLRNALANP